MTRRVKERVDYDLAKSRVIRCLKKNGKVRLVDMAYAVWPDAEFRWPQGAAFAVSKIAYKMREEGLIIPATGAREHVLYYRLCNAR